jgi:hypothetical protein
MTPKNDDCREALDGKWTYFGATYAFVPNDADAFKSAWQASRKKTAGDNRDTTDLVDRKFKDWLPTVFSDYTVDDVKIIYACFTGGYEAALTTPAAKPLPDEAEKALIEMYAVLNDSDRWHKHVRIIRAATKPAAQLIKHKDKAQ